MIFVLLLAVGVSLMAVRILMMAKLYSKDTNDTHSYKTSVFLAAFDFALDVLTGAFFKSVWSVHGYLCLWILNVHFVCHTFCRLKCARTLPKRIQHELG